MAVEEAVARARHEGEAIEPSRGTCAPRCERRLFTGAAAVCGVNRQARPRGCAESRRGDVARQAARCGGGGGPVS